MYRTSIPATGVCEYADIRDYVNVLRSMGADRIFLTIGTIHADDAVMEKSYRVLKEEIRAAKEAGLEVGVWFWTFRVEGKNDFTPIRGFSSHNPGGVPLRDSAFQKCPLDENFLRFAEKRMSEVAALGPDLILLDDDLRFGFLDSGSGCVCPLHRKKLESLLGEPVDTETLFPKMYAGAPNRVRDAYLRVCGESLREYARRMRAAVDRVDPRIRLGQCACLTTFDADGVDSFEISRILAGSTKPLLRLIGAPYWAENRNWGNRLEDVIELERMECAWSGDTRDMEIISEGDTYPRPRFRVPASYLELFDSALRADGNLDGILKYVFTYYSRADQDPEYQARHNREKDLRETVSRVFDGKDAAGIRVWDQMKKVANADFSDKPGLTPRDVESTFFCMASRMLAENAIPTTYRGTGCAGIAFGEAARALPPEAFERPLILDVRAARILSQNGVDVGIRDFGGFFPRCLKVSDDDPVASVRERFPAEGDRVDLPHAGTDFARDLTLCEGAVPDSFFCAGEAEVPACFTYRNADGNVFIIYNFDAWRVSETALRNYYRPRQLIRLLGGFGVTLPAVSTGNPDLYLLFKENRDEAALGLWNCHADYLDGARVTLGDSFRSAEFFGCTGSLSGKELTVSRLSAFEYCYVLLKR